MVGSFNTLLDNASAVTTLWVQGDDGYNAGVLTAAPGAFNAGTIILASSSAYWGDSLAAPSGLVNLAGGHIAVYGGGGPAALTGTLTNDGYLSLSGVGAMSIDTLVNNGTVGVDATGLSAVSGLAALADAAAAAGSAADGAQGPADAAPAAPPALTRLTVGAWTNYGAVGVDAGTQLEVAPDGSGRDTFTQAGGLVAADGRMIVDGGLFHFSGGALLGGFTVRDGWIRVDPSVTQASAIDVVGHSNTLLNNAGAAILRVQGGSLVGDGDAVLTAADASTNAGAIVLESLDGAHHGYFEVLGNFTNAAGGRIQVNLPPGDPGQGSITAGWLANDGGTVADTTALPTLPPLQAAVNQAQAANNSGGTVDPATALLALLGQTPGTNDGVIVVGGVSGVGGSNAAPPNGDGNGGPDGSGGLIGVLDNFGDVIIGSVEAPLATAGAILDGATDGVWSQVAVPVVVSAWQGARPYVEQYGLPLVGAAGQFVQDHVQPVVQQVVVPFIEAAAGRVAALPQNVVEIGSILHDGVASVLAASSPWWAPVLGQQSYQASLWSAFAHGLQQAQAQGNGLEYAVNAGLNAATLGLYGDAEAFLPAYEQAQATGSLAPLAAWAGGTTADAAMNPLAAEALGAAGSIAAGVAAGEWPLGEAGSAARLAGVATAWSAEAAIEAGLGESTAGLQAATEAGSEANLSEAVQSAEATAETTAAGGDAADAGQLAEAEVTAADAEAAAREGSGTDAAAKAAAVDAAASEVEQAQQACLAEQGSPGGCFSAGIPMMTPDGGKLIESFKDNDHLFTRNEGDPNGPPIVGTVEKVFVRMAPVLELRLEGQVIGTTAEHRFWVEARKAWTAAGEIRPGDRLLSHDGRWVEVEALKDTGRVETVYNLRVSGSHTYFVGGLSWGFAVWAHNAYDASEFAANEATYNTWREAAGFQDTPALRELYLNATLRGDMSTTLPSGEEFTVGAPGGPEGLYQVVRGEFLDGYNQNNLDSAYSGLADLARQQRLAAAPTIPDEGAVLQTMMDYDATTQNGGNPRDFNNGTGLVDVVGGPQAATEATPNHVPSILFEAAQQAMLPDTEAIYIDRSLSSVIAGPDFAPDIEPDIVRKINDTTYEITEILSSSQSYEDLAEKLDLAQQQIAAYNAATGQNIQMTFKVIPADYTPEMLDTALGQ